MSGGTAYLLDADRGAFNRQALEGGELHLRALDATDRDLVKTLLTRHAEETGSTLAAALLLDCPDTAARITAVVPVNYAAVLATLQEAEREGLDPDGDAVWTRILEAHHG